MKFDEIILLLEWKEDLERGNVLLHYTDYNGLVGILKNKRINKQWYDNNHYASRRGVNKGVGFTKDGKPIKILKGTKKEQNESDDIRKKKFGEVSLVRPSSNYAIKSKLATTKEKEWERQKKRAEEVGWLSDKNYIAECILYTDKIRNSVRNWDGSKINEFAIKYWRKFGFLFSKLNEILVKADFRWAVKVVDEIQEDLLGIQKMKTAYNKWSKIKNRVISLINQNYKNTKTSAEVNDIYKQIEEGYRYFNNFILHREGEERTTEDIPLKSKFVQIRFLSPVFDLDDKKKQELFKLIQKDSSVFLIDSTYEEFLEQVKKES